MGILVYEDTVRTEIDDRLLTHLQIVIGTKLRRNEPFFFTWEIDTRLGGGRNSMWMHAGANLLFIFHGSRRPAVNPEWLDALMRTANSSQGLQHVPEPPQSTEVAGPAG